VQFDVTEAIPQARHLAASGKADEEVKLLMNAGMMPRDAQRQVAYSQNPAAARAALAKWSAKQAGLRAAMQQRP